MAELKPIMLVEDEQNDIDLTLAAFRQHRLANPIAVARDGAVALEYLRGRPDPLPAVVLLDLKMPKVDGLEVLQAMRADDDLRQVPVVVLTASHDEADRLRSEALGVDAYIVKPVEVENFLQAVTELGLQWGIVAPEDE
jgi:CheY-like chemotaxis protein